MKTTVLLAFCLVYAGFSYSQPDPQTLWTWIKGDNIINQSGNYGTQGIAASTNKPGARNYAATWRDDNGHLWMFGGNGYVSGAIGYLNDLWKYDPQANTWTWMKGNNSTDQLAVYGTQGNAHNNNKPGSAYGPVTWKDQSGQLWLFGGFGYTNTNSGYLNSLWKYNPSLNQWTWVKGDKAVNKTAVYGTRGVAHINNRPGARYGSCTWVTGDGQFWLFGGYGYDGNATGLLNDLWTFNPASGQWTWVHGDTVRNTGGVYGSMEVSQPGNKPGARLFSTAWTDQTGRLWIFGGYGKDETSTGNLNDVWRYDPALDQWTWMKGDKFKDQPAVYGEKGFPGMNNKPGGRYVSTSWAGPDGELWIFGGYGMNASTPGYLNDLWKYNPADNAWCWSGGDSTVDETGVYGVQGLPDATNKSGARTGSVSWFEDQGTLWMFGGYGFDGVSTGSLNDLWKINNILVPLPLRLLDFSGVLQDDAVQLQWVSELESAFSHFVVERSLDGQHYQALGEVPGKGLSGVNHYRFTDADLHQPGLRSWYYRLKLVNRDGHFTFSKVLFFTRNDPGRQLRIFPNPAAHTINISVPHTQAGPVRVTVTDLKGAILLSKSENLPAGRANLSLDIHHLPPAVYILRVALPGTTWQEKLVRQ